MFIIENVRSVDVRLIGPVVHLPLAVIMLIVLVVGSLGTLLLQWRPHLKP